MPLKRNKPLYLGSRVDFLSGIRYNNDSGASLKTCRETTIPPGTGVSCNRQFSSSPTVAHHGLKGVFLQFNFKGVRKQSLPPRLASGSLAGITSRYR